MFPTCFYWHEPEAEYHSRSKNGTCLSSHLLADFRNSPLLYWKKINGEIAEKPNPAFAFGSAAHKLILEGQTAFDKEYMVSDGPVNPKTSAPYGATTKAYLDWCAQQDKKIVSEADFALIRKMRDSVWNNETAKNLLSVGAAECVTESIVGNIRCQIRMDWFSPGFGLVDYKTCAELRFFESDARRYGYIYQMAFYRRVIQNKIGADVPVHIIATEKCEPYSTGVWNIVPSVLDQADGINRAAIVRLDRCKESGVWPTGYETLRVIDSL